MEEKKVIPKQLIEKCPECKSINLVHDYDTGEIVCGDCGLVLPDPMIDKGPEWRAFTPDQEAERARGGRPETLTIHDKGLSTTMKPIYHDAFGRMLPPQALIDVKRLSKRQEHLRVHSSIERNLAQAMTELDRLAGKLSIPTPIKEKAALIYRKALTKKSKDKKSKEKNIIRGRSINGIVAASLYMACRDSELPRTLQEIAEASSINKKEIGRCYRLLLKEMDVQMPAPDPIKYISKIAEKIGISQRTQGSAIQILHQAKAKKIHAGKDRRGLAAAALYIACSENNEQKKGLHGFMGPVTQKNIADAAGVTEVTVRNRYQELKEKLGKISK